MKDTLLELHSSSLGKSAGVWEAAGIGSEKEGKAPGSCQWSTRGHQNSIAGLHRPSLHQKMLVEGKSDLSLSFYINQFFAYTDSRNVSPLNFFSECDRRNNNLVQQSNWIYQNSSSVPWSVTVHYSTVQCEEVAVFYVIQKPFKKCLTIRFYSRKLSKPKWIKFRASWSHFIAVLWAGLIREPVSFLTTKNYPLIRLNNIQTQEFLKKEYAPLTW